MQRDFVAHTVVQETWINNTQPVVDLFLEDHEQRSKHTKAFAHQVSLHSEANRTPECSRLSHVRVKTLLSHSVDCDQVSLDHAFYYVEYIPREKETTPLVPGNQKINHHSLAFVNLDDLTEDKEYEMLLAILQDDYQ